MFCWKIEIEEKIKELIASPCIYNITMVLRFKKSNKFRAQIAKIISAKDLMTNLCHFSNSSFLVISF